MKPIGTIGIIIAVVLSLFAVVPNLVNAQTTPAAATTSSSPAATPAASGTAAPAAGAAETETKPTPGVSGPTYPTIPFADFKGTTEDSPAPPVKGKRKTAKPGTGTTGTATSAATAANKSTKVIPLAAGSFGACVEKQFGIRFQLLPAAAQAQILKEYARYAVSGAKCLVNPAAPVPFDPLQYGLILVGGSLFLMALFSPFSPFKGFLEEVVPFAPVQAPSTLDPAITATVVDAIVKHSATVGYSQAEFAKAVKDAIDNIKPAPQVAAPQEPRYKFSASRLIALLGTYVIIVTFAFAARYGYWALTFGDNSVFEKITSTILIGGVAAFAPYFINKITDAAKPAVKE